ncbi:hypothetical protein GCM10025777_53510 [Membranihabitans marinus]
MTDGEVHYYGVELEKDSIVEVNNADHLFEIGSITKVFTAALLAEMVVSNKMQLDDSIQQYLPFPIAINEKITLKQLSNHSSGLPRLPSNLDLYKVDINNPYKDYGEEKLKEYLTHHIALSNRPGEKYDYSNLGTGLLGYILTLYTNVDYENLLHQFIFSKYNMSHSSTQYASELGHLVVGLNSFGQPTTNWDLNVLRGAGDIKSTVRDLSYFATAIMDESNTALQMTTEANFKVNSKMDIGLGWHITNQSDGENILWHNGGTGGYTSCIALNKEAKQAAVVLSNVSAFHKDMDLIEQLCFELLDSLRED